MMQALSSILTRNRRLGGATSGYILLAATATFLLDILYQAVEFQVFNGVAAAMIGVVAIYSVIAIRAIATFSHRSLAAESTLDKRVEMNHLSAGGNDDNPDRPNLRLLQFDSFESADQSRMQNREVAGRNGSSRAA